MFLGAKQQRLHLVIFYIYQCCGLGSPIPISSIHYPLEGGLMYLLPCCRHKPQIGSAWSVDWSPLQRKHVEFLHNFTWGHFIKGASFWLTFSQPHCFECPTDSFHSSSTVPWFCILTLLCLMRHLEKSSSQSKLCKLSSWMNVLKAAALKSITKNYLSLLKLNQVNTDNIRWLRSTIHRIKFGLLFIWISRVGIGHRLGGWPAGSMFLYF